jgi:hypothetical protein
MLIYFRTCKNARADPKCPKGRKRALGKRKYCGIIRWKKGPFKKCINGKKKLWKDQLNDCIYDACALWKDKKRMRAAVCKAIEAFEQRCRQNKLQPGKSWRRKKFCRELYTNIEYRTQA